MPAPRLTPAALALALLACATSATARTTAPSAEPSAALPSTTSCSRNTQAPPVPFAITIQDNTGAAIPGARVTVTCGTEVVSAETDSTGTATLRLLPGSYRVVAAAPGFSSAERPIAVSSSLPSLTLALAVGAAGDVVNVSADGGFVPFSTNFGSDSLSEISTWTNEVEGTYIVGSHPSQAIASRDNSSIWISDFGADAVE